MQPYHTRRLLLTSGDQSHPEPRVRVLHRLAVADPGDAVALRGARVRLGPQRSVALRLAELAEEPFDARRREHREQAADAVLEPPLRVRHAAGREDEVAEQLFQAYFLEGANLSDQAVLAGVGERAGLDRAALAAYLASEDGREDVLRADLEARQAGITGVPCFIFNRRTAVSGAQAPETLLQAMLDA